MAKKPQPLPGITAIRSVFTALAFAPSETKHIAELFAIGGTDYMGRRAQEMLAQFVKSGSQRDLEMTIQLLTTVHALKYPKGKRNGTSAPANKATP